MKGYTSFLSGQKLSENIKKFTDTQIEEGILRLNDPGQLRLVVKWCEELQKCFDEHAFMQRDTPFRMRDGS